MVNPVGFRGIHPPTRVWQCYLFAAKLYDLFVVILVGCRGIHSPTRKELNKNLEGILLLRFRVLLYDLFVVNLVGFRVSIPLLACGGATSSRPSCTTSSW